ncbi:MAG: ribosome assembly factor SBDS [Candidatus Woesearchaeota archaeon]
MKEASTYGKDNRKEHFHIAKLKKGSDKFEITINPELALQFRDGKDVDIHDVITAEFVFSDAKKGLKTSTKLLQEAFNTKDIFEIAAFIIKHGEVQLTQEHREAQRALRMKRIIEIIHQNCIDTKTGKCVSVEAIADAIKTAKVNVDEMRTAEDQVRAILPKLQTILPLRMEMKEIEIHLLPAHAASVFSYIKNIAIVDKDTWNKDGSLTCSVQIPAGLYQEFIDKLNDHTHGEVETKLIKK